MTMMNAALLVLWLSLACGVISMIISKASLFRGLREWITGHNKWLGELLSCPFCTSVWVSLGLTAWYRPRLVESFWSGADYFVSAMVMVFIASLVSGLIYRSFAPMNMSNEDKDD